MTDTTSGATRPKTSRKPKDDARHATVTDLLSKPVRTKIITMTIGENGSTEKIDIKLRAIGSKAYDTLLSAHPPKKEQKDNGESYDVDTFCPALIQLCMIEPHISPEESIELWNSDTWSRGELTELFFGCVEVNSKGLDVPFT